MVPGHVAGIPRVLPQRGGKRFADATEEAGLGSFLPTSAYTYVLLNNTGYLDIVEVPTVGPVVVYMNNSTGTRIVVELRDEIGNRFGIGSKIILHYRPGGSRHQMREIQASGGFLSFDARSRTSDWVTPGESSVSRSSGPPGSGARSPRG